MFIQLNINNYLNAQCVRFSTIYCGECRLQ